jgi:hypothetical protein
MKRRDILSALSIITLILLAMHIADDYVHGIDKKVLDQPYGVLIFVVWGIALVFLRDNVVGRAVLLLGGLAGVAMPIIHMKGRFPADFAQSNGAFRFVWTLYIIGMTGMLTMLLAAEELVRRPAVSRDGEK